MKKLILLTLLLAGCATHEEFHPYNDQTESDWSDCNYKAYQEYEKDRSHAGVILGALLLGPIGAVTGDSIANPNPTVKDTDIPIIRDKCMKARGYAKTTKSAGGIS